MYVKHYNQCVPAVLRPAATIQAHRYLLERQIALASGQPRVLNRDYHHDAQAPAVGETRPQDHGSEQTPTNTRHLWRIKNEIIFTL